MHLMTFDTCTILKSRSEQLVTMTVTKLDRKLLKLAVLVVVWKAHRLHPVTTDAAKQADHPCR